MIALDKHIFLVAVHCPFQLMDSLHEQRQRQAKARGYSSCLKKAGIMQQEGRETRKILTKQHYSLIAFKSKGALLCYLSC